MFTWKVSWLNSKQSTAAKATKRRSIVRQKPKPDKEAKDYPLLWAAINGFSVSLPPGALVVVVPRCEKTHTRGSSSRIIPPARHLDARWGGRESLDLPGCVPSDLFRSVFFSPSRVSWHSLRSNPVSERIHHAAKRDQWDHFFGTAGGSDFTFSAEAGDDWVGHRQRPRSRVAISF